MNANWGLRLSSETPKTSNFLGHFKIKMKIYKTGLDILYYV